MVVMEVVLLVVGQSTEPDVGGVCVWGVDGTCRRRRRIERGGRIPHSGPGLLRLRTVRMTHQHLQGDL